MLEFYNSSDRTARKQHVCDVCGDRIDIGQRYHYIFGKYEGDTFQRYHHLECEKIVGLYCSEAGESEYTEDDIAEWWTENRCPKCRKYYVDDCDLGCGVSCNNGCNELTKGGKCKEAETCDIMDRGCWCTQYEPEGVADE